MQDTLHPEWGLMSDTTSTANAPPPAVSIRRDWLLLFLTSFAVYAATANRGVQWQDSGMHMLRIVSGQLHNPLGLALTHPLHYALGRLAIAPGIGEPSFMITLVSALAAAVALANVYGCVIELTARRAAALFATVSLGLAMTFWQMATRTECNSLTAALLAGECWCLAGFARRGAAGWLIGMAMFNGLGIANHLQAALTTPIVVAVVLIALRRRIIQPIHVVTTAVLWFGMTLPYTSIVFLEGIHSGEWGSTLRSALFGRGYSGQVLNVGVSTRMLLTVICFPILNFPNLLLPAAVYGMLTARRLPAPSGVEGGVPNTKLAVRGLMAGFIIHALFAGRYNVADQYTFFLPMYVFLAIFGGIGAARVLSWPADRHVQLAVRLGVLLLLITPAFQALLPLAARLSGVLEPYIHHKPYRDDYTYLLSPWSFLDGSAQRMGQDVTKLAGSNGIVFVQDDMAIYAIRYCLLRAGMGETPVKWIESPALLPPDIEADRTAVLVPSDMRREPPDPPGGRWVRSADLYILERLPVGSQPR